MTPTYRRTVQWPQQRATVETIAAVTGSVPSEEFDAAATPQHKSSLRMLDATPKFSDRAPAEATRWKT
jgi:hypothetical protein